VWQLVQFFAKIAAPSGVCANAACPASPDRIKPMASSPGDAVRRWMLRLSVIAAKHISGATVTVHPEPRTLSRSFFHSPIPAGIHREAVLGPI
jgi:hypothetical protein